MQERLRGLKAGRQNPKRLRGERESCLEMRARSLGTGSSQLGIGWVFWSPGRVWTALG